MAPEREIEILKRTLDRRERFWLRAARKALDGDLSELRNRVDMHDAEPAEVVLSVESKEPKE